MITATKIDIIKQEIFCYDETNNTREIHQLDSDCDAFMSAFADTQELLTVNIINPTPRVIKFYGIKASVPDSFVVTEFSDMTDAKKIIFTNFVEMIKVKV